MQHEAAAAKLDRRLCVCTLLAAAGVWLAMAGPMLLGRVYLADDLGAYHLPLRAFYAQQLHKAEPFDWLPNLYNGYYVTGEGQTGGYHPLHLVLYRLLPLPAAFDLELLLSYPWMFAGMYLLLARRIGSRSAALFGALVFTFSGFNLLHFIHPNAVAVVAHLPWLLVAIEVLLTSIDLRRRVWMVAAIALLTGSQLLLGYPQYVWFSLVAEACYVASRYRAIAGPAWRPVAGWLAALALGLLVGSIQLLPTIDALKHSTRAAASADFANSGSLAPLNVLQLVAPYLFGTRVVGGNTHELGLYIGAVPLLLCWWLFLNRQAWGSLRPLILAATALGVLGFALALGNRSFVYALQTHLPLVGAFRFPCRAIVLMHFALAVLAAIALPLVSTSPPRRASRPFRLTSYWLLVAFSLLTALLGPLAWSDYLSSKPLIWAGPVLLCAGAVALAAAESGWRWGAIALVLLTALDLGAYGISYAVWPQTEPLGEFIAGIDIPPNRQGSVVAESPWLQSRGLHAGNQVLLAGYRRADGYSGLEPIRRLDLTQPADKRLADVHWQLKGWGPTLGWHPVADALPRARLVSRAIVDAGGPIPAEAAQPDAALVDEALDLPPGEPGTVDVVDERPGRFELTCQTPAPRLLAITESHHSGWQARVDGQSVPVLRVNRDFLGCVVAAGAHRVELEFRPASLRQGATLSSLGLGLIVGLLVLAARLGGPSPNSAPPEPTSLHENRDEPSRLARHAD